MTTPPNPADSVPTRRGASAVHRPNPTAFATLADEQLARWQGFGNWDTVFFPKLVGVEVEELRSDYARMRLPFRPELNQPAGVMHGGAIATLIDTVVVPAIGTAYDTVPVMLTLSLNINFLGAIRDQDAIGEGWVVRRGRSVVFCEALVCACDGTPAATGSLVYNIRV